MGLIASKREILLWRVAQAAVWLVGVAIVGALFFVPAMGIHAFWNILIPVAPALLVIAPGIWRNICPMASMALFTRHKGWSKKKRLSPQWNDRLALMGFLLLVGLIPLRHVVMDTGGPTTAVALLSLVSVAVIAGYFFEWKSAWCSGLCPVHPVERLYGSSALVTTNNAHCHTCERCVLLCPDSTPTLNPLTGARSKIRRFTGTMMVGGFAGYIYGWFQVPDYAPGEGWAHLDLAYGYPYLGFIASLSLFLALNSILKTNRQLLIRVFSCAAVASYYWFRVPALVGFGPFPGDGMLIDLTHILPAYFPILSKGVSTTIFVWLLLLRNAPQRSWAYRPEKAAQST